MIILCFCQYIISVAIVFYVLNIGTNVIGFEIVSYVCVLIYCLWGVSYKSSLKETQDFSKFVILCILFIECVLFIFFLYNNREWLEETKKKPYQYRNLIDFIRIIFLSQVLMTQVELDSKQYPVVALNILLFVFWITTFVILRHMINTQKIY